MREILFRGKKIKNGEWIYGYYFQKQNVHSENGQPIKHCISDLPPFGAEVIPETVGQYTGLPDKNGKKIFEGDIVKVKTSSNESETTENTRVGYDAKSCGFFPMIWETSCDGCDCYFRIKEIEVIGNIHDNPELLKGGAEK